MQHFVLGQTWTGPLTADRVSELITRARHRAESYERVSVRRILRILDRAGRAWSDPSFAPRQRAEAELPGLLGMTGPMVSLSLEMMGGALRREVLEQRIERELGPADLLDRWTPRKAIGEYLRARPRGVVLTVASGNVFVGAAILLAESLLTGNVTLLKASSGDPFFARLFVESLAEFEEEGELTGSTAVLSWSGGDESLESLFKAGCDAIVITGGEEAVRRYRQGVDAHVEVVDYGPKLSLAVLTSDAPAWEDLPELARRLARDVSMWDQHACSSPQVLYVEGAEQAERLLEPLARALEELDAELPAAEPAFDTAIEVTKERQMAMFAQAVRPVKLLTSPRPQAWTLIYEPDESELRSSPLHRTLLIKTVERPEETLPRLLEPWRIYLQTVGLEAGLYRSRHLGRLLTQAGATRICRLGEMAGGQPGEPHDGRLGLQPLVRWVSLTADAPEGISHDWETRPAAEAEAISWERLLDLVEFVRSRSPYYRDSLAPVRSREEFARLPLLERSLLHHRSHELLTAPLHEAVVLRSGGSTGDPKYCFLSPEDYRADVLAGVKMLRALGVRPGDRCANLFLAGDLYGSFLSIHRVLEEAGVVNFPFTASAPLESLLLHFERFEIGVVLGVSSQLSRLFADLFERGARPPLKTLIYGGEPLPPGEQALLRERFGLTRLGSILGANDGGPIGYQCSHCQGAVHHLATDQVWMELVDSQGRPAEEGEVILTCLQRRLMPLIRYRLGDRARWLLQQCPCGRTTPRFELLGRADDLLCIASTNTSWQDVAEALVGLVGAVQLVGEKQDLLDVLRVRVEGPASVERVRARLLERLPLLGQRLEEGLLADLRVEVVGPGELERISRSGKLRHVIDRRL